MSSTPRRGWTERGAMTVVALAMLAAGCTNGAASEGPLRLPQDYGFVMAPVPGGTFSAFDICSTDGSVEVEIVAVEPRIVSGVEQMRFKVAWPDPDTGLPAAGRLPLHDAYRDAAGSTGTARDCNDNSGSGMDLTVVLPPARSEAVLVEDIAVTYRIDTNEYTDVATVRLGTCASAPEAPQDEPEECAR